MIDDKPIGWRYAIGTKAMIRVVTGYRVTCASCEAGGTKHKTYEEAFGHAVSNSNRACRTCGAS